MREEVLELIRLGSMPSEDSADVDVVRKYEELLHQISPPLTTIEASNLLHLFGPDSFFGLAWTLVILIESAPGWPEEVDLPAVDNEWIQLLRIRAAE
jgi:hypothetical protein